MLSFFSNFIWESFKINNDSIIPKKLAILPPMVYFYIMHKKGGNFSRLDNTELIKLKKYLILSQISDWNLQSLVDNFTKILFEENKETSKAIFPLEKFISFVDSRKIRNIDIHEKAFINYTWFSLKILTPDRTYNFDPTGKGRFSPEIDHIFPKKLKNQTEEYYNTVDIIWNMQPIKGEINNYKRRRNPKEFFNSEEGKKYLKDYDFIEISANIWDNPAQFIENRKNKMKKFLESNYDIILK